MKRTDLEVGQHVAYRPGKYHYESEVVVISTDAWIARPYYSWQNDLETTILPVIVDGVAKAFDISNVRMDDRKRTALIAYVGSDKVEVAQLGHLIGSWEQVQEDRRRRVEEQQAYNLKAQAEAERLEALADDLGQRLGVKFRQGNYGGWNTAVVNLDDLAKAIDRLTA
jgi:hypothetical protein